MRRRLWMSAGKLEMDLGIAAVDRRRGIETECWLNARLVGWAIGVWYCGKSPFAVHSDTDSWLACCYELVWCLTLLLLHPHTCHLPSCINIIKLGLNSNQYYLLYSFRVRTSQKVDFFAKFWLTPSYLINHNFEHNQLYNLQFMLIVSSNFHVI